MSRVSVIIPLYNAEKYIKETIESILNQTYSDFDVIVVDDCSTDRSYEIVSSIRDMRIHLYKNEINLGIAKTRNRALELATGEFIAIMDNDDLSPKYRLKESVDFLDLHKDCDIVGGHCRVIDKNGDYTHKFWNMFLNDKYIRAVLLFSNNIPNSSAMIRKSFIDKYNIRYRDDMYGAEDYRFWVECSLHAKFGTIDKTMLYWRDLTDNATNINLSLRKKERERTISEIQKYALNQVGIVLEPGEYEVLFMSFAEEIVIKDKQQIEDLYKVLLKIVEQAKKIGLDNANEIKTMCRKKFGERIAKAFFLWE